MDILFLPLETVLNVAEQADAQTVVTMMRTCKTWKYALNRYQNSIVKNNLQERRRQAATITTPSSFPTHHTIDYAPGGTVLLTATHSLLPSAVSPPRRLIARPNSYEVTHELERREQRLQLLLGSPDGLVSDEVMLRSMKACAEVTALNASRTTQEKAAEHGLLATTPHERAWRSISALSWGSIQSHEMLEAMRQACRIADRIGDVAATVLARWNLVDEYNAHLFRKHPISCQCHGWEGLLVQPDDTATRFPPCTLAWNAAGPDADPEDRVVVPMRFLAYAVRSAQMEYIKQLSTDDQCLLRLLARFTAGLYKESYPETMREADTHFEERMSAFGEIVLRLGATPCLWALYCQQRARGARAGGPDPAEVEAWKGYLHAPMKAVSDEFVLYQTSWDDFKVPLESIFDPSRGQFHPSLRKVFEHIRADVERNNGDGGKNVRLMLPKLQHALELLPSFPVSG